MRKQGSADGADAGQAGTGREEALIVVCLRPADPGARVDPVSGRIDRDPGMLGLPAAEAAALEHGLRVARAWAGRVLAVTAADESADEALRQVMALGVGVLRVPWPPGAHGTRPASAPRDEAYLADLAADERALAAALAVAVQGAAGGAALALVLTGDRSADRGTGALPAYLAHELGAAQALGLIGLEPEDDHLIAERRLDGGRRERLRVPRPAVCSVEAASVRLRRAGLPGVLAAAQAAIPVATPSPGGGSPGSASSTAGSPGTDLPVGGSSDTGLPTTGSPGTGPPGASSPDTGPPGASSPDTGPPGASSPDTGPPGASSPGTASSGVGPARIAVGRARPYRPPTRVVPPPPGTTARERLLELTGVLASREPPAVVGPVDAAEAADALLEFLDRTGHLPRDLAGVPLADPPPAP